MKSESQRLENFAQKHQILVGNKIAKGYSSHIYIVKWKGKKYALKIERDKSPRKEMLQKEVKNLRIANGIGIGPKLKIFDSANRCILMEFINGVTFDKWLFGKKISKKQFQKFLHQLFLQANSLDRIGLDHGQLAGRGRNIIVRKGLPVIIDFEKASTTRKAKNFSKMFAYFFQNPFSRISNKSRELLLKK